MLPDVVGETMLIFQSTRGKKKAIKFCWWARQSSEKLSVPLELGNWLVAVHGGMADARGYRMPIRRRGLMNRMSKNEGVVCHVGSCSVVVRQTPGCFLR